MARSYAIWTISLSTPTLSDHQQIVHQVLSTLQEWRLFLKPEKCKFEQKEVEYLRLVILKDHVTMDLMKVCGVTEWPTPMKVKEVQSFLGFVNFYQKFIHNFSDIACPLYTLTHKTQQWVWGSPKQEAFDALKKAVTSAPVLTFPSQSGVGRKMVRCVSHLWRLVSVIGIHCYYRRMRIPS